MSGKKDQEQPEKYIRSVPKLPRLTTTSSKRTAKPRFVVDCPDDTLDGENVLPVFRWALAELWEARRRFTGSWRARGDRR